MGFFSKPYDLFLSYVVEDREFVERLYEALEAQGLHVWYAKNELYPGAKIRRLINEGLSKSRFGVAVFSPFYNSHWALGELFNKMQDKETLIPVLHQISIEELARIHPELITCYCLNSESGVDQVAEDIAIYIKKKSRARFFYKLWPLRARTSIVGFSSVALLVLSIFLFLNSMSNVKPEEGFIIGEIEKRITEIQNTVKQEISEERLEYSTSVSSFEVIKQNEAACVANTNRHSNAFDFYDGRNHILTQKGLKNAGLVPNKSPIDAPFGLSEFNTWKLESKDVSQTCLVYALENSLPMQYLISEIRSGKDLCEIDVTYSSFLRYAVIYISIDSADNRRINKHRLFGIQPLETFVFEKEGETWALSGIR